MRIQENSSQMVLQPETEGEQTALNRLMETLGNVEDGPLAWFTLDVAEYPDLDHDLARRAVFAPERDRYDAGARALVIDHGGGA